MTPQPPPGEGSEPAPLQPLLGLRFWLLISFAAVCVLAGLGVAWLGPVWFPAP